MKSRARLLRKSPPLKPDDEDAALSLSSPGQAAPEGLNQVRLSGHWVEQAALRYTPAGLPALDLTLEHQGQSMEAGSPRKIDLKLRALALGELAKRLQQLPAGQSAVFNGFLASARNGKGVVMHITGFESVGGA